MRNAFRSAFGAVLLAGCISTPVTSLEVSWVAPQVPQALPTSCGSSFGQVEISGASARCVVDTGLTIIGNDVLV